MSRIVRALALATVFLLSGVVTYDRLPDAEAQQTASIRVHAGETVEIGIETLDPGASYSWILTKDRTFQGAQRGTFFQTRMSQPGTYVLDVSIQNASRGSSDYRALTIDVDSSPAEIPIAQNNTDVIDPQLTIEPISPTDPDALLQNGGIVKIDPSRSTGPIASYVIDTQTTVDTDGDGITDNDRTTAGTISERSGSPIYLWILPSAPDRKAALLATSEQGGPPVARTVAFRNGMSGTTSSPQALSIPGSPLLVERDGLSITVSLSESAIPPGMQTITTWDFGDRARSLLHRAEHRYARPGSYTVRATVTDITTGTVLLQTEAMVTVEEPVGVVGSTSSSSNSSTTSSVSSSVSSSEQSSAPSGKGFVARLYERLRSFLVVGVILLVLLGIAIGLYMLLNWIKRVTTGSLQQALERVEESLVKKAPAAPAPLDPQPMQVKPSPKVSETADAIAEREKSHTEFTPSKEAVAPVSSGPVPPWLSASKPKNPEPEKKVDAPMAPSPMRPPVRAQPMETPSPMREQRPAPSTMSTPSLPSSEAQKPPVSPPATKTPATQEGTAPMPSWLQPQRPQTPAPKSEAPASNAPAAQKVAETNTSAPPTPPLQSPSVSPPSPPSTSTATPRTAIASQTTTDVAQAPTPKNTDTLPPSAPVAPLSTKETPLSAPANTGDSSRKTPSSPSTQPGSVLSSRPPNTPLASPTAAKQPATVTAPMQKQENPPLQEKPPPPSMLPKDEEAPLATPKPPTEMRGEKSAPLLGQTKDIASPPTAQSAEAKPIPLQKSEEDEEPIAFLRAENLPSDMTNDTKAQGTSA